jgi:hypothetical protein
MTFVVDDSSALPRGLVAGHARHVRTRRAKEADAALSVRPGRRRSTQRLGERGRPESSPTRRRIALRPWRSRHRLRSARGRSRPTCRAAAAEASRRRSTSAPRPGALPAAGRRGRAPSGDGSALS